MQALLSQLNVCKHYRNVLSLILFLSIVAAIPCVLQEQVAMLQQQVAEAEGEVQVLLSQLAVQSKLAVASSKELTHLHDLLRKQENQHRLVSLHMPASPVSAPTILAKPSSNKLT